MNNFYTVHLFWKYMGELISKQQTFYDFKIFNILKTGHYYT